MKYRSVVDEIVAKAAEAVLLYGEETAQKILDSIPDPTIKGFAINKGIEIRFKGTRGSCCPRMGRIGYDSYLIANTVIRCNDRWDPIEITKNRGE